MASLPKYVFVNDASILRRYGVNAVRTDFEYGPAKTRPIQSVPMINFEFQVSIPKGKINDFDQWWAVDLNYGTNFFFMNDPFTGAEKRFRFVDTEIIWNSESATILKSNFILESVYV